MPNPRITKAVVGVEYVDDDSEHGSFDLIVTTDQLDRDGEVVAKGAFEPLPDHLSADVDHAMSVEKTVGSGAPYVGEDGNVRVRGTFASTELGQKVRTLVKEKHIRFASLAFIRETVKTIDGIPTVTKGEMLNFAFTPVPSNTGSKVLSAKSLQAVEALQTGDDERPRAATKSIVGSVEALQDRVRDALRAQYAGGRYYWGGWIRGVVLDAAGGTVVFEAEAASVTGESDWRYTTWQQAFTDDGDLVTLTGDAEEVDVAEVVLPDAEAARTGLEVKHLTVTPKTAPPSSTSPAKETAPATKAAADPDAADPELDELHLRVAKSHLQRRITRLGG